MQMRLKVILNGREAGERKTPSLGDTPPPKHLEGVRTVSGEAGQAGHWKGLALNISFGINDERLMIGNPTTLLFGVVQNSGNRTQICHLGPQNMISVS